MPVFLDSNVFIYAAGGDHPLRAPCADLLRRVAAREVDAITSAEVIQEIHRVFRRRNRVVDGVKLGQEIARLFPDLLAVTRDDVLRSGAILAAVPNASARHALHAATALNHGIDRIVSVDLDLDAIPGVKRVDPSTLA